jgi:hypothetical protein
MTPFRLTLGAALLTIAAGAHAAPTQDAARPIHEAGLELATLAPEGSTALIMLVGIGLTIVTRRNRRSVRSVQS